MLLDLEEDEFLNICALIEEQDKEFIKRLKEISYHCTIKELRTALGWTQSDLAREVGFTSNAINMMEREKYYPPLETRLKIAKALHTDTSAVWIPREREK